MTDTQKTSSGKFLKLEELEKVREHNAGRKIVHCHGVFDLLHTGHLAYFESAKRYGDLLVVTVTTDEYANKGPGRPYFTANVRAKMLAALEVVDHVAISESPNAQIVLEKLKPHFYVKGPDYRIAAVDQSRGLFKEKSVVEKHGGQLVFTEDQAFSSSHLINQFFNPFSDDQNAALSTVRELGGLDTIKTALERVTQEHVCILGEPIIDTYVFCIPEALSSKSPTISARYIRQEDYAGGSLAIANHLADFVDKVTLVFTYGAEAYVDDLLKNKMNPKIDIRAIPIPNIPTPRKTRYLEPVRSQRVFELTHIESDQWHRQPCQSFLDAFTGAHQGASSTILADFGHGLFEGDILGAMAGLEGFVALNVQTNSSNLGFNPVTKHQRYSYLSLDHAEIRVAYQDRFTNALELARNLRTKVGLNDIAFSMTLGPGGSRYFPKDSSNEFWVPAFTGDVVDATGAGDAYFALSSMLVKVGCPDYLIPFVGNVFAGIKTRIIGNKRAVTKRELIKALAALLK